MWKEAAVAYFKIYPSTCLEGLRETSKTSITIIGVPAEIRTRHIQNKSQNCFVAVNPLVLCYNPTQIYSQLILLRGFMLEFPMQRSFHFRDEQGVKWLAFIRVGKQNW
jgi:hypothetical protein